MSAAQPRVEHETADAPLTGAGHSYDFEQMLEVFGDANGFKAVETPESLKALVTNFEQEFNSQGIPTNYAAYRSVGE